MISIVGVDESDSPEQLSSCSHSAATRKRNDSDASQKENSPGKKNLYF